VRNPNPVYTTPNLPFKGIPTPPVNKKTYKIYLYRYTDYPGQTGRPCIVLDFDNMDDANCTILEHIDKKLITMFEVQEIHAHHRKDRAMRFWPRPSSYQRLQHCLALCTVAKNWRL
jgi:hypothetical protein